ncbi:MAG: NB-ARC domain-containing protein [Aulosira sp. ZfuVER01]|nr:NB-ARC domain-containing protein [Aulosira sp. ZfuVER01]MDZ8000851.1 NB-ARC domain-containing protein [Aulosira sp. DedVER01a]MDZ8055878.1 NB-ARC domain-containing protein [Aulosira sp. ZfuCHP01]
MNINQRQRLETQRDTLQAEWDLRNEKLKQLQLALAIETGVAVKFQLQQQILAEETELKRLEHELDTIEQALSTPNVVQHHLPLGNLCNVPELPPHFLPRPEELAPLKHKVLSSTKQPVGITGKSRRVGVQGMGGIGKTVLATALARDEEVRKAFPDGVFWVTFGQTPQILTWQSYVASALGDKQAAFTEIGLAKARLRELFAQKACLLILDDIWRLDDATPFDVLGERCQMLVTTRDAAIVTGLGGQEYQLAVLDAQQALALLANWSNQPEILQPSPHNDVALQVARECGYLPLALAMVGAMMRGKPPNRWQNILEKLRSADLEKIKQQFPDYPYPDLLKAIAVSVAALDENCQQRYLDFAVFPEDTPIPEAVLQTFWQPLGLDEFDSQDAIDELVSKSLALRDEAGNLRLHDLQFDYVRKQYTTLAKESEGIGFLHNRLLNAYSEKYPEGWHSLKNDGYIWQNLAYHLLEEGRKGELQQLLCDFRWLQAKLENININALLADYDFLPEDENLQLIQGALRLSAHILNEDKQQLAGQLLGRLLGFEKEEIQRLLTQAQQCKIPGLLPQTASLTPPGGFLVRTLVGHSNWVSAVALSPDGKYVISGSHDNTLKVWNWETGEQLQTFTGHSDWVHAVAFTLDGKYVISGSLDKTIKVWNWETGEKLRTLAGHSYPVNVVAITPDNKYVISGSSDNTLKVWNWETGEQLRTLEGHRDWVNALAITSDGKYAISASRDNTLKVWNWKTGEQLRTLEGHTWSVNAVAITSDNKYVVSASGDSTLKVWNWETGEQLRTLTGHSYSVNSLVLAPDNKYVISGSLDSTLKVWNWETGEQLRTLTGHTSLVKAVTCTPDGNYVISTSHDNTLKVWNWHSGKQLRTLAGHSYSVNAVVLTPDGKYVISASRDNTLKVWNWETGEQLRTLAGHSYSVNAVVLTSDGNCVISASGDYTLKVWNWENGEQLRNLTGHASLVKAVACTPDGNYVISGSYDNTLKVWNWHTGEQLHTLMGHNELVNAVALTPDGKYVISGSYDNTLKVWNWQIREEVRTLEGHSDSVNAVALTPDSKYVISASSDKTFKVWNWETGELLRTLEIHSSEVNAVALTPDGKYVISASSDYTLKVWNWQTEEVIASFTGESVMYCCAIAADGVRVVAGDASGRMYFLRLEGKEE